MQKRHERVKRPWFFRWMFPNVHVATGTFWDRRERYFKTNFPIRYKVQVEYPRKFRRFLRTSKLANRFFIAKNRLGRVKWWILFRTIYRYHIIHTHLQPDHYDPGTRMLHGCFSLLVEHAERETRAKGKDALQKIAEWAVETNEEIYLEEYALLHWWMIERPTRLNPWSMAISDEMAQNTKEFYADQDDTMLVRLIQFRTKLF